MRTESSSTWRRAWWVREKPPQRLAKPGRVDGLLEDNAFETFQAAAFDYVPILATYGAADFIDRPDFDASVSEEVMLNVVKGVSRILPALEDATIVEQRGDLLAMAPTPPFQKPVMGRFPNWQNAYIASRFGGDGICMSPAAGELMAELIDTTRTPLRARYMFEKLAPVQ